MDLKTARIQANLTQHGLALKSGISQPVLSLFESGQQEPTVYEAATLEQALNQTVDWKDQYRDQRLDILGSIQELSLRFPTVAVLKLAVEILSRRGAKNPVEQLRFLASRNRLEKPLGMPGVK